MKDNLVPILFAVVIIVISAFLLWPIVRPPELPPDITPPPLPSDTPTASSPLPTPTLPPTATPTTEPTTKRPTATPTMEPTATPTATVAPGATATPEIRAGAFYTIKRGDTLWYIAGEAYGKPHRYFLICWANSLEPCWLIHAGNEVWIPAEGLIE